MKADTQDVEALVASESGIHSPLNACCHRETCRTLARERDEARAQLATGEAQYSAMSGINRALSARVSSLEAQLAGAKEALDEIAESPGPFADDAAWVRCERARKAIEALASAPASAPSDDREPETEQCETCQGNGEIVTDWERYRHPRDGDAGDEAVDECPDCNGEGCIPAPASTGVGVKALEWRASFKDRWEAAAQFGASYGIVRASDNQFRIQFSWSGLLWNDEKLTLDAAKDAAQADFETRIRSCLTPSEGRDGKEVADDTEAYQTITELAAKLGCENKPSVVFREALKLAKAASTTPEASHDR